MQLQKISAVYTKKKLSAVFGNQYCLDYLYKILCWHALQATLSLPFPEMYLAQLILA